MKKFRKGITFGAFDPLHYGHIKLFQKCREQCEFLVVAISSGGYIEAVKHRDAYVSFEDRRKAIELIRIVNQTTKQTLIIGKKELIEATGADVIFVGDDWEPKTFSGEGLGVPVIYLPYTKLINSTELREKKI